MRNSTDHEISFIRKVLITTGIISLFAIVLLLAVKAFNVILLMLGGILIATWFRGTSFWISNKLKISETISVILTILGTIAFIFLLSLFLGTKISAQVSQFENRLPASFQSLKKKASNYEWGKKIISSVEKIKQDPAKRKKITNSVKRFLQGTMGVLGDIYVMLFIGVFFTATPKLYTDGILRLIPPVKRNSATQVINRIGYTLRSWLIGKIFAMIIVTVLTGIALTITGIPFALVLAIIAGLLNFIPNFGPLIAMIPAVLIAFTHGGNTALIIATIYIGIQVIESNFITPLIQKRLIEIPPALIIIAQVFFGLVTGALGLILATPIVAIVIVLIKSLYVEPIEGKARIER